MAVQMRYLNNLSVITNTYCYRQLASKCKRFVYIRDGFSSPTNSDRVLGALANSHAYGMLSIALVACAVLIGEISNKLGAPMNDTALKKMAVYGIGCSYMFGGIWGYLRPHQFQPQPLLLTRMYTAQLFASWHKNIYLKI